MSPPRIGFDQRIGFPPEYLVPWSRPLANLFLLFSAMPISPSRGGCHSHPRGRFAPLRIIHHIRGLFARLRPRLGGTFTSLQRNWLETLGVKPLRSFFVPEGCGRLHPACR